MPARSASSRASLLARTLKPMMAAFEVSASLMSDSVIPPTPEWITRAPTSSVPSLSSAPMIASTEPCTSPLTTTDDRFDRALHVALDDQLKTAGRKEFPLVVKGDVHR